MITIRHIRQVIALNRFGSFRRAAEDLCISQPALSRSILTLEENLGVKIFDRSRGKIEPTRYGAILLQQGEAILKEVELMQRDITMIQGGEKGVINIGCGPFPAEVLAGEAIGRFNKIHPKMSIKLKVDYALQLKALLRERRIDFFVAETYPVQHNPKEYETIRLPQQQGYFCCRKDHPLASMPSLTARDVFAFPLALMWVPKRVLAVLGELLQEDLNSLEDWAKGFVQCDNLNTLLRIVGHGEAFTITTREMLDRTGFGDELCLLPLKVPDLKTNYSIVSLRGATPIPAISRLRNLFVKVAEDVVYKD